MIVILTPNPAIDCTYRIPTLTHGQAHRVEDISQCPGGKGVNVAMVLAQLGYASTLVGPLGAAQATWFTKMMTSRLVDLDVDPQLITQSWTPVPITTRRSVAVVDDTDATVFNEAGTALPTPVWDELGKHILGQLKRGDVLAICGSFPPETPSQVIDWLLLEAHCKGVRVLVDSTGEALACAVQAGVTFIKPNHHEYADLTRHLQLEFMAEPDDGETVADWAERLAYRCFQYGVKHIAVSFGSQGMQLHRPQGRVLYGKPPRYIKGNPTGAGDAGMAAWCVFWSTKRKGQPKVKDYEDALSQAIALSGAAVAMPTAGLIDVSVYYELAAELCIEPLDGTACSYQEER